MNSVINTSGEMLDALRVHGLDSTPDGYDSSIWDEVVTWLNSREQLSTTLATLVTAIQADQVPLPAFFRAFLHALTPYAAMLSDIYEYFAEHDAVKTEAKFRIRLELGESAQMDWDLDAFREIMQTWSAHADLLVMRVPRDLFWSFVNPVLHPKIPGFTLKVTIDPELSESWQDWLPELPNHGTLRAETSTLFTELQMMCSAILDEARSIAPSRTSLRQMASQASSPEVTTLDEIRWLVDDFIPHTLMQAAAQWITAFRNQDLSEDDPVVKEALRRIRILLDRVPFVRIKGPGLVQSLSDILALPIWERRHELYSIWVLVQTLRASSGWRPRLNTSDGALTLAFRDCLIASADTVAGVLEVHSELRHPYATPVGDGRISGIQPDVSILHITSQSRDVPCVVESKQYKKSSRKNFLNALKDYTGGLPSASVILVNHGPISSSVLAELPPRSIAIGAFRPRSDAALGLFRKSVIAALPLPRKSVGTTTSPPTVQVGGVVVVDCSSSMAQVLSSHAQELARFLSDANPTMILAFDDKEQGRWHSVPDALAGLSTLRGGGTNLNAVLIDAALKNQFVCFVTDTDGADQLASTMAVDARVTALILENS